MNKKVRDALCGYAFVGIWIIGFLLLTIYPMIRTIIFSFQKVKFTDGLVTENIMFANFKAILTTDLGFMTALKDFIGQVFIYVPIIIIFSFVVAIMLNQKIRFRGFFRAIYFLPVIIISGPIVNELFAQGITSLSILEEYGIVEIINNVLPEWLANPIAKLFDELIFILWLSGVQIIIFISGLSKIDRSVYEAAKIDGSNGWVTFWKITLPSMSYLIAINVLYSVVTLSTFSTNEVIKQIKIDKDLKELGYGYASAEAIIYIFTIFAILLVFFLIYKFFTRKEKVKDGIFRRSSKVKI